MLIYRLNLPPHDLQHIHTALEELERAHEENHDEKNAFKIKETRLKLEEQLEKQGIQFMRGEEEMATSEELLKEMTLIARPINGISINGNEYVLDDGGRAITFRDEEQARIFLLEHGMTEEEIETMGVTFPTVNEALEDENQR